jgi:hypothetical protein
LPPAFWDELLGEGLLPKAAPIPPRKAAA